MRIGVATEGSTGDVQPYVALARALKERGHQVQMFSSRPWEAKIAGTGVTFVDSGSGFDEAEIQRVAARLVEGRNPFQQLRRLFEDLLPAHRSMLQRLLPATRGLDVLVAHGVDFPAIAAAQVNGVPLVLCYLFPAFMRTRDSLPLGPSLGRVGNALAWKLLAAVTRHYTDRPLDAVFTAAGLPSTRDVLLSLGDRARRVLVAVSPSLFRPDSAWGDRVEVTGYWFLDEPAWTPPPELERFMAGAERPVVISFGSMIGDDPAATTRTLVEAVRRVGCRAVMQAGWANLGAAAELPETILRVGYAPHHWLFCRAACVVHHGGAGTTAAALRAGVPQLVVWHAGDQPGWGQMVQRRGVGPPGRSHRRLTARWLEGALRRVLGDRPMQARAAALGTQIQGEDGLGAAVRAVERLGA